MRCRIALFAACLVLVCGICAAQEMKKLKVGEITITYPPDLEKEAKEVARVAGKVLPPKFKQHKALQKKLSDTKRIAGRIVEILGCPEYTQDAEEMLSEFVKFSVDIAIDAFQDIRLYHWADFAKAGETNTGTMEFQYTPGEDLFSVNMRLVSDDPASKSEVHWPVVYSDDDSLYDEKPLGESITEGFDEWSFMPMVALHEAAEGLLMMNLEFYHPFTRWFNEGVASWVMLKLVPEIAPEKEEEARKAFLPSDESKALRPKVDLYAWQQAQYSKANPSKEEEELSSACYGYSAELITRLMDDQTPTTMAAIIYKLKSGDTTPDTDRICRAVKEVTGKDCRATLLEYVPESIRKDMESGRAKELKDDAREYFAGSRDFKRAAESLEKALEIEPSDPDGQFSLAFLMRKVGGLEEESVRHAKIAAHLVSVEGTHQFRLYEPDDPESMYLMGRMNQCGGYPEMARTIFRKILEKYPDHADSKKALEELGKE